MFAKADLIHSYSRAQALADGALMDVSATAKEAGLRWPVALTRAVSERCAAVPWRDSSSGSLPSNRNSCRAHGRPLVRGGGQRQSPLSTKAAQ